jgi:Fe-S-cluster-containing hydrogenase component 2
MKKAKLIVDRCDNSPFCGAKRACSVGAIEYKKTGIFSGNIVINEEKCIGCGKCVSACPHNAIKI